MKLEPGLDMLQAQVEFRVLVGPQAGSCLSLSVGEYSLGTSDDCDVILMAPRLEGTHAKIYFDGDQVFISPLDGKICDAQGNEIKDTFPLSLGMPVDLSGIWVCVDNIDSPWPNPADVVPLPPSSDKTSTQSVSDHRIEVPQLTVNDSLRRRAKITLLISSLGLIFIVLAGLFFGIWLANQETPPPLSSAANTDLNTPALPARQQKIIQILKNLGLEKSVDVKVNEKGGVIISGYLKDATLKVQLLQALENISPSPAMSLFIDTELLESAKQIVEQKLDPNKVKLRLDSISNGVLRLQGAAMTPSVRDNAFDILKTEVAGLRKIEGTVLLSDDLPQQFQERIVAAGFSKKLQIVSRQPEFVLRGSMSDEDLRQWESVLLAFTEDYGKILPIRASIRTIQKKSPVNIQIIVGGGMPFVITESGQRVTRGGDVNGHTLITVKDSEVIFEGNDKVKISR